jgi:hypothetical protein
MTRNDIDDFITNTTDLDVLLADNLDVGFVGVDTEADPPRAVYSIERCIKKLAEDMTHEEATEYFWYNVAGACGDGYPVFITTPEDESHY